MVPFYNTSRLATCRVAYSRALSWSRWIGNKTTDSYVLKALRYVRILRGELRFDKERFVPQSSSSITVGRVRGDLTISGFGAWLLILPSAFLALEPWEVVELKCAAASQWFHNPNVSIPLLKIVTKLSTLWVTDARR